MATTKDDLQNAHDAYGAAFNEDHQPAHEMSEDEAFGITPENVEPAETETKAQDNAAEDAAEGEGDDNAIAIVIDGDELQHDAEAVQAMQTAKAEAEAGQGEGNESVTPEGVKPEGDATNVEAPEVDLEKEKQRLKSWEGRLKAMQAKLEAAGADTEEEQAEAVGEAIEQAAEQAETPAEEQAIEQVAEQVESGQMTPEQAMKQLEEDFGPDFVRMIEVIATAKATEAGGKAVNELKGAVDEIIEDIKDTKTRNHFEQIAAEHPDFQEIGESEQFRQFVESMPEEQKQAAIQVIGNGSAKQINQLLSQFKDHAKGGSEPELTEAQGESIVDEAAAEDHNDALDAAEGVRSAGMKLPEQPASSDNYEDAWNEA